MQSRESIDPKAELLKKSERHRQELQDEVKLISERTEKIVINALIIGGTLATAYLLMRVFSGSSPKKKKKFATPKIKLVKAREEGEEAESVEVASEPGVISQIGTALASQATVFLLTLAKEKLMEYLESQFEKKDKKNERS